MGPGAVGGKLDLDKMMSEICSLVSWRGGGIPPMGPPARSPDPPTGWQAEAGYCYFRTRITTISTPISLGDSKPRALDPGPGPRARAPGPGPWARPGQVTVPNPRPDSQNHNHTLILEMFRCRQPRIYNTS